MVIWDWFDERLEKGLGATMAGVKDWVLRTHDSKGRYVGGWLLKDCTEKDAEAKAKKHAKAVPVVVLWTLMEANLIEKELYHTLTI